MPKPSPNEKEDDFVSRCVPIVLDEGTAKDGKQAAAICHSIFREAKKKNTMTPEQLLTAIKEREISPSGFNYGIQTADRYVKTMLDAVGSDLCYMVAAKSGVSFADAMEKAAKTLVFSSEDAEVHEKATNKYGELLPEGVELPKNTLMVFRHTLTTPRKDRDGDILHPEGMEVDPKMLLLWQHVHTMPIGKMLVVAKKNTKTLDLWSCIVDINETSHDAAVMVDNKMGRFSHGFKATEFDKVKARDGKETGFEIHSGEIMEESLVSVPANVDAGTQEVILSLVEGGKLTSPVMKEFGSFLRHKRPTMVPVQLDLKVTLNGQEINNVGTKAVETGTSKEADEDHDEGSEEGQGTKTTDTEVKSLAAVSIPYGSLPNSYEYVINSLSSQVAKMFKTVTGLSNEWSYLVATFDDHVIVCQEKAGDRTYYKIGWDVDDSPILSKDKKEVNITQPPAIITEKQKELWNLMVKSAEDKAKADKVDKEKMACPKCGSTDIKEGVCQDCGYQFPKEKPMEEGKSFEGEKKGRMLSKKNEVLLRESKEYMEEAHQMDVPKPCKACIGHAKGNLGMVLDSLGQDDIENKGMVDWLANSTMLEREKLINILSGLNKREAKSRQVKSLRGLREKFNPNHGDGGRFTSGPSGGSGSSGGGSSGGGSSDSPLKQYNSLSPEAANAIVRGSKKLDEGSAKKVLSGSGIKTKKAKFGAVHSEMDVEAASDLLHKAGWKPKGAVRDQNHERISYLAQKDNQVVSFAKARTIYSGKSTGTEFRVFEK